ncbi:MAG: nucleotidyl transferase AbiEii/AbiGii toxin family protein [Arcobacter butzleri]|nr:nucleotidyl transferase AbiEii/AbiGii toxin family protein [Aliarcobacter butzleri]
MNGYLKNFELQINTLKDVYFELLQPIEKKVSLNNWWLFGGGTALSMFYFKHTKSFGLEIFITERQVFDFLDPKWFIDESKIFDNTNYRFNRFNHHLALRTKSNIKVDFLVNESIINCPIKSDILNLGFDIYVESVEDIIAKKILWRKEDNLARDIFDLALAIVKNNNILLNLIDSRFISIDDLKKLNNALTKLDKNIYKVEIGKIEPEIEFTKIADNAQSIIYENIKNII